jgi:hypothetical protein
VSTEPRTREIDLEELTRALAPLGDGEGGVAARPIRVARELFPRGKFAGDPATTLGVGAPHAFPSAAPARPSTAAHGSVAMPASSAGWPLPPVIAATPPRTGVLLRSSAPARPRVAASSSAGAAHARVVDGRHGAVRSLRAWHAWLAAIVLAGFALGGLAALTVHATRATARVPAAIAPLPPTLPTRAGPLPPPPVAVSEERERGANHEAGPAVAERRSAVDALLVGRTRIALEHYRRALAAPAPLADRDAIEQVTRVLARELQSCEREAGTPCGF